MYDVTITNNYFEPLYLDDGKTVLAKENGGTGQVKNWGSHSITVPRMGDINFIDMAEQKLSQYTNSEIPWTKSTWGGLVRYRGLDAYFRYEGQGGVELTVDQFGSVQITFAQGGMIVSLDDLVVS